MEVVVPPPPAAPQKIESPPIVCITECGGFTLLLKDVES